MRTGFVSVLFLLVVWALPAQAPVEAGPPEPEIATIEWEYPSSDPPAPESPPVVRTVMPVDYRPLTNDPFPADAPPPSQGTRSAPRLPAMLPAAAPVEPPPTGTTTPAPGPCPSACGAEAACCCRQEKDSVQSFWMTADYLLWWVKGAPLPPVITTGPFDPNTFIPGVMASPGAIGSPNTVILRGGHSIDPGTFSGLRLHSGYWFTPDQLVGLEGGDFLLEHRSVSYTAASNAASDPLLKVPFFDTFVGQELGANVSFPNDAANLNGGLAGSVVAANSLRLWGGDFAGALNLLNDRTLRIDMLVGFRYLDLDETASLVQDFTPIGQPLFGGFLGHPVPVGSQIASLDNFHTRNQFYGGTLAGRLDWQLRERLGISLLTRVALARTEERSAVNGLSTLSMPGTGLLTARGGTLALPSNIGVQHGSDFAVVPEVNLILYYQLTSYLRTTVGYSFLYWSDVVRPGSQIDRNVDSRQIPTGEYFIPGVAASSPGCALAANGFLGHRRHVRPRAHLLMRKEFGTLHSTLQRNARSCLRTHCSSGCGAGSVVRAAPCGRRECGRGVWPWRRWRTDSLPPLSW